MPKIRVIYKNGREVTFRCDRMKVTRNRFTGQVDLAWTNARPNPLLIGVDDVAAVWEL